MSDDTVQGISTDDYARRQTEMLAVTYGPLPEPLKAECAGCRADTQLYRLHGCTDCCKLFCSVCIGWVKYCKACRKARRKR